MLINTWKCSVIYFTYHCHEHFPLSVNTTSSFKKYNFFLITKVINAFQKSIILNNCVIFHYTDTPSLNSYPVISTILLL